MLLAHARDAAQAFRSGRRNHAARDGAQQPVQDKGDQ